MEFSKEFVDKLSEIFFNNELSEEVFEFKERPRFE
jgi:hypothetical protein